MLDMLCTCSSFLTYIIQYYIYYYLMAFIVQLYNTILFVSRN